MSNINVGDTIIIKSEKYGSYNSTCIAFIDLLISEDTFGFNILKDIPLEEKINKQMNWMTKYHPRHYFSSHSLKFEENSNDNTTRWFIFVPLERYNKEWKSNQKKKTKLPIAISDKKLKKWLDETKDFIIKKIEI